MICLYISRVMPYKWVSGYISITASSGFCPSRRKEIKPVSFSPSSTSLRLSSNALLPVPILYALDIHSESVSFSTPRSSWRSTIEYPIVCATALTIFFQLTMGACGEVLLALLVLLEALRFEPVFEFALAASSLFTVLWAASPLAY